MLGIIVTSQQVIQIVKQILEKNHQVTAIMFTAVNRADLNKSTNPTLQASRHVGIPLPRNWCP